MEKKTNRIGRKRQIDYGEKDDRGINIFKVYRRFILIKQKINYLLTIIFVQIRLKQKTKRGEMRCLVQRCWWEEMQVMTDPL